MKSVKIPYFAYHKLLIKKEKNLLQLNLNLKKKSISYKSPKLIIEYIYKKGVFFIYNKYN